MPARLHRSGWQYLMLALAGLAAYVAGIVQLGSARRDARSEEMRIVLPRPVQAVMTMGDRFLAANIAVLRAMVASTEKMLPDNFAVQGRIQRDAAWFNPAHTDNYYLAAAILPWNDEFAAGQEVLRAAIEARRFDWQPAFYFAFNIYYFQRDAVTGANWLRRAAQSADSENNRLMLENIAVFWYEKGYDTRTAIAVIGRLADSSRNSGFKRYLLQRADRLRVLLELEDAADSFNARFGRPPRALQELVDSAVLAALPVDPAGVGFDMDAKGRPIFRGSMAVGGR